MFARFRWLRLTVEAERDENHFLPVLVFFFFFFFSSYLMWTNERKAPPVAVGRRLWRWELKCDTRPLCSIVFILSFFLPFFLFLFSKWRGRTIQTNAAANTFESGKNKKKSLWFLFPVPKCCRFQMMETPFPLFFFSSCQFSSLFFVVRVKNGGEKLGVLCYRRLSWWFPPVHCYTLQ